MYGWELCKHKLDEEKDDSLKVRDGKKIIEISEEFNLWLRCDF